MKIKEGFKLRTVMGQPIVVAEGAKQINFNKLISLNESAELMWKGVEGKDFDANDLADILTAEYDIDRATALADATAVLDKWVKNGLVDE